MKKILVAALAVSAISAMAETKPYVSASVGYALGQPSGNLGTDDNEGTNSTTSKNIYGTVGGNALHVTVAGGVMDNSVVGAELAATYVNGLEQEVDKTSGLTNNKTKSTLSAVLLTPSVVIAAKGPFTPYAKFGVVFGTNMSMESKTTSDASSSTRTYTGGTAFGFQGALGGEFKAPGQEKLGFTLELAAQSVKWAPTDVKVSSAGVSKEYTFEDEITSGATTAASTILRKQVLDLSNVAIKVGFNYHM